MHWPARQAGFDNVSLDLYLFAARARPGEVEVTLEQAIGLAPDHISAYSLIVEEDTPLFRR